MNEGAGGALEGGSAGRGGIRVSMVGAYGECSQCCCPAGHRWERLTGPWLQCVWCQHDLAQHRSCCWEVQHHYYFISNRDALLEDRLQLRLDSGVSQLPQFSEGPVSEVTPALAWQVLQVGGDGIERGPLKSTRLTWHRILQVLDPDSQQTCGQLLATVMLNQAERVMRFQQEWALPQLVELCQLEPAAMRLQCLLGTPLPLPYFQKFRPGSTPFTVLPGLAVPQGLRPQPAQQECWLSDDVLLRVGAQLDMGGILTMSQVCHRWNQLCGENSPVWNGQTQRLLQSVAMDNKKSVLRALSARKSPRVRFERALFAWVAKNPASFPLRGQQSDLLLQALYQKGSIPKDMVNSGLRLRLEFIGCTSASG
jgi:hypothetical protein